jgi:hypothetical protein
MHDLLRGITHRPVQLHPSVEAEAVLHHDDACADADFVRHNAVAMMNMAVEVDEYTVQLHPPLDRR